MDEDEESERHEIKKTQDAQFSSIKSNFLKEFNYESYNIESSSFNRSKFSKQKRLDKK